MAEPNPILKVTHNNLIMSRASTIQGAQTPTGEFVLFLDNTTAKDLTAGIVIRQMGTGDPVLHFDVVNGQKFTMGLFNANNDMFVLVPDVQINNNATKAFSMDSLGYIHIGGTLPLRQFHIQGTDTSTAMGANMTAAMLISNQANTTFGAGPEIQFTILNKGVGASITAPMISNSNSSISYGQALVFSTNQGIGNAYPTERMRIDYNGRIGIGNNNPTTILDITGRIRVRGGSTEDGGIWLTNKNSTVDSSFVGRITDGTGIWTSEQGWFFVVKDYGQVGIGTTNPVQYESNSLFTVQGNLPGDIYAAFINTGSGGIGSVYRRTGSNASRWQAYIPAGIDQFSFYSSTAARQVLSLGGNTSVGINETNAGAQLDVYDNLSWHAVRSTIHNNSTFCNFAGRRALVGAGNSLSPLVNTATIMAIGAFPYTSSGWATTPNVQIMAKAAENYTSTGRGSFLEFLITEVGSTVPQLALSLGSNQMLGAPGINRHTTASVPNVNVDANGVLRRSTSTSSARYKKDIEELSLPDNFFDNIRPVTFRYNELVPNHYDALYIGMVAEEVDSAGGSVFVMHDDKGRPDSINYDRFNMALVWEVKNLRRRVAELERKLA